jgi:16S rRNA (guanine(966)-N(2))-methyltransferase RsmD
MKILKGSLKGRNIFCPGRIRPVSVVVRKACFDILREVVEGKRILDLFAGSGALGLEAISCGAKEAVFVDINKACIDAIRRNVALFKVASLAKIHLKDAVGAVKGFFDNQERFDIIFLDPPYYKGTLRKILQNLEVYDIVTPFGYLVGFCYRKDDFVKESKHFSLIIQKNYGQTLLLIYKKNETSLLSGNF